MTYNSIVSERKGRIEYNIILVYDYKFTFLYSYHYSVLIDRISLTLLIIKRHLYLDYFR